MDFLKILFNLEALGFQFLFKLGRVKRIWYISPMRAAKVQASLRMRAVSPEPPLLAHTSSESRGTFRQKARSLAPLNGWACAVTICHDGMLEDTNSLDAAQLNCFNYESATIAFVISERFSGKYWILVSLSVFSGYRHYQNIAK